MSVPHHNVAKKGDQQSVPKLADFVPGLQQIKRARYGLRAAQYFSTKRSPHTKRPN